MVASLSAAAAVLLVVAGVLVIARDDDGAPQPIGPPSTQTPSPTESTATTAEWSGPIRSGTWPVLSPKQAKGWADPRDTAVPGIDIRKVTSDWTNAGWWGYALAARPPRIQSLDPAQRIFEYGVVIDADGDQDADCQVGLNNNAAQHGEYGVYRVWVTNLRTNVTDERVGPPYGFPIEFQTANEYSGPPHGPPHGLFTFLRQPRAPCDRFGTSATFYLWASHTNGALVVKAEPS